MANTVNIGTSARATAGRGQGGKRRFGDRLYRAIGLAAIAVVVLGLAVGTTINRTRTAAVPDAAPSTASNPYWEYVEDVPIDAPQSVLTNPFAYDSHVYSEWDFREDRRDPVPADASTTTDYLWDFGGTYAPVGPVPTFDWEQQERTQVAPGPVPAFDWEQQERTQVAPGAAPSAAAPIPGSGPCRPGSVDCLLDEAFVVGVKPAAPTVYAGPCRAGSSECLPEEYITPGGAGATAGNNGSTHSRDY